MIPTTNLATLLLQSAARFPDRAGLIRGERVWTWGEIAERVRRAAGALAARGVATGCSSMRATARRSWRRCGLPGCSAPCGCRPIFGSRRRRSPISPRAPALPSTCSTRHSPSTR